MYQRQYQTLCSTFTHALLAKGAIFLLPKILVCFVCLRLLKPRINLMHAQWYLLVVFVPGFWDYTCALSRNRRMGAQALLSLVIAQI